MLIFKKLLYNFIYLKPVVH